MLPFQHQRLDWMCSCCRGRTAGEGHLKPGLGFPPVASTPALAGPAWGGALPPGGLRLQRDGQLQASLEAGPREQEHTRARPTAHMQLTDRSCPAPSCQSCFHSQRRFCACPPPPVCGAPLLHANSCSCGREKDSGAAAKPGAQQRRTQKITPWNPFRLSKTTF